MGKTNNLQLVLCLVGTAMLVAHTGCGSSLRSCLDTAASYQEISTELAISAEANYMAAGGAAAFRDQGRDVIERSTDECTKQITIAHCMARDAGVPLSVDEKGQLPACRKRILGS